jgi:hypothetical protein
MSNPLEVFSDEIWKKLEERASKSFPLLGFHSIFDDTEIKDHELPEIDPKTTIYVYQHRQSHNVFAVGTKYTRLFTYKNPGQYVSLDAVIDFVSLKKGDTFFYT